MSERSDCANDFARKNAAAARPVPGHQARLRVDLVQQRPASLQALEVVADQREAARHQALGPARAVRRHDHVVELVERATRRAGPRAPRGSGSGTRCRAPRRRSERATRALAHASASSTSVPRATMVRDRARPVRTARNARRRRVIARAVASHRAGENDEVGGLGAPSSTRSRRMLQGEVCGAQLPPPARGVGHMHSRSPGARWGRTIDVAQRCSWRRQGRASSPAAGCQTSMPALNSGDAAAGEIDASNAASRRACTRDCRAPARSRCRPGAGRHRIEPDLVEPGDRQLDRSAARQRRAGARRG